MLTNGKFNNSTGNISSAQIGTFNYTGTSFAYQSGIIMTTGNVSVAAGPNNNTASSSTSGIVPLTDSQLSQYTTNSVMNSAILEFDFVAYADTFSFNYIFGSEEYPEYACSSYNDVFAFLLTGPDPVTGATVTKNVAIIPNSITAANPTGVPVAINTINGGPGAYGSYTNCSSWAQYTQYYQTNPSNCVQYDGYTVSLAAQGVILACQQYHMRLSIANVGDNGLDSGVFLEEGSFYSPSMEIIKRYNLDSIQDVLGDTIIQNCRELDIRLQLPREVMTGNYHSDVQFLGDATYGVDYVVTQEGLPMDVVENAFYFTQGSDSVVMHLSMLPSATCQQGEVKTAILIINTIFCDDYYNAGHTDAGRSDTLYFYLKCNDTIRLQDQELAACYQCDSIYVELASGAEDLLYEWIPATGIENPNAQSSAATIEQNTTYRVVAKDRFGCLTDTTTVDVTIHEKPEVDLRVTPESGCAPLGVTLTNLEIPDNCQIAWTVTNNDDFELVDSTNNPLMMTLDSAGYYDVSLWLSTAPGCSDSIKLTNAIHVSDFPHANFTFSPEEAHNGETVYFTNTSTGENITSYHWNFGDGGTSTEENPTHAYRLSTSENMMVRFVVANDDGCSDDTTQIVPVIDEFALYVPNSFTPNNDNINDEFLPKVNDVAYYRLEIYDRNGNVFFVTENPEMPWDGTINGKPAPTGIYVWTIRYIRYSNVNRTLLKRGTVTLLR